MAILSYKNNENKEKYILSLEYDKDIGVKPDDEKSMNWYHLLARKGGAKAQNDLGVYYMSIYEYNKGLNLLSKAAMNNSKKGQYNYGYILLNGIGVNKNTEEGVKWIEKSANNGYLLAQYKLFHFYANGTYVKENEEEAIFWGRKTSSKLLEKLTDTHQDYALFFGDSMNIKISVSDDSQSDTSIMLENVTDVEIGPFHKKGGSGPVTTIISGKKIKIKEGTIKTN